jgi:hypothetical protein
MQSQLMASLLQHLSGLGLLRREAWDFASLYESAERLHVVGIPLGVYAAVGAFLEIEDRGLDIRFLALADLALAVEVPDGLGEGLSDVRTFLLQSVPDVVGGDDIGLPSLESASDTKKTYDI